MKNNYKKYYRLTNKDENIFEAMKVSGDCIAYYQLYIIFYNRDYWYNQFNGIKKHLEQSNNFEDFIFKLKREGILLNHEFGDFFYSLHLSDGVCCLDHFPEEYELENIPNKQEKMIEFYGIEVNESEFTIQDGIFAKPIKIIREYPFCYLYK